MIFIPFLDKITKQYETLRGDIEISLRGNKKRTYPAPELFGVKLPVNLLAFNLCETQRDVYLFVTGKKPAESWERYRGRVIHTLYHEIWKEILTIINSNDVTSLDLDRGLTLVEERVIKTTLGNNRSTLKKIIGDYSDLQIRQEQLYLDLKKIFSFERVLSSALVHFELASLFSQTSGNPLYQKALTISIGETYNASILGFTNPVSPDFRYKSEVVGDIKTGPWREYYYHTITAYALAIEANTGAGVNCGVILHVNMKENRQLPIHEKVSFEVIDDYKRKRFLTIRDEKLRIAKEKTDPGLPESSKGCKGCGYYSLCWG